MHTICRPFVFITPQNHSHRLTEAPAKLKDADGKLILTLIRSHKNNSNPFSANGPTRSLTTQSMPILTSALGFASIYWLNPEPFIDPGQRNGKNSPWPRQIRPFTIIPPHSHPVSVFSQSPHRCLSFKPLFTKCIPPFFSPPLSLHSANLCSNYIYTNRASYILYVLIYVKFYSSRQLSHYIVILRSFSAALIPHASAAYSTVGTTTPS